MWNPMIPIEFPYRPTPSAADEGLLPVNFNQGPAQKYEPLLPSTVVAQYMPGIPFMKLSPYLAVTQGGDADCGCCGGGGGCGCGGGGGCGCGGGAACCEYAAYGCPCRCSSRRRRRDVLSFLYDGLNGVGVGYAQPTEDWPGIGQRMGFGPGPYVQWPEVFELKGRTNLAPFKGY